MGKKRHRRGGKEGVRADEQAWAGFKAQSITNSLEAVARMFGRRKRKKK